MPPATRVNFFVKACQLEKNLSVETWNIEHTIFIDARIKRIPVPLPDVKGKTTLSTFMFPRNHRLDSIFGEYSSVSHLWLRFGL
jgi:hypothetical protein